MPIFFSPPIQNLLHELTGVDMEKVFEPKKLQTKLRTPEYKFMTTDDLEKVRTNISYMHKCT